MSSPPEPDRAREQALQAAILDLATAFTGGQATEEELTAAVEAVRQVPVDMDRMLNALHVPEDAGEYEDILRSMLLRIPDGWGRWITCGRGWYPILAALDERLRTIDPDYTIHQIKEKYGTLRFYWEGKNHAIGEAAVAEAEAESAVTCERCGALGSLRSKDSWLRTLCDGCAVSGHYNDVAPSPDQRSSE